MKFCSWETEHSARSEHSGLVAAVVQPDMLQMEGPAPQKRLGSTPDGTAEDHRAAWRWVLEAGTALVKELGKGPCGGGGRGDVERETTLA